MLQMIYDITFFLINAHVKMCQRLSEQSYVSQLLMLSDVLTYHQAIPI